MEKPRVTIEQALWAAALLLALGLRLVNLGAKPLSDHEAQWALQALSLAPGTSAVEPVLLGSQISYLSLTSMLFSLLGSSNALARILPVIAGVLLCLAPYFIRSRIGRLSALIIAFGFAVDPAMVAMSRLAGGPMLAVGFTCLGLCLLVDRKHLLAGIFLGLALLSGPAVVQGILILTITWVAAKLVPTARKFQWISGENQAEGGAKFSRQNRGRVMLGALGSLLVCGILFGTNLSGLGAWFSALPDYFRGWTLPAGIPSLRLLAALLVYQPIAVIFGLVAIVVGWLGGDSRSQWFSLWLLAALGLTLLFPARQMGDLLWALVALWSLASFSLADIFQTPEENKVVVWIQAAAVFVLLALFWLNLAGLNLPAPVESALRLRWVVLIGVLFLIAVVTLLIGFGWSWTTAIKGFAWGVVAAVGVYTISGMWAASQPSGQRPISIWDHAPVTGDAALLLNTVSDLSEWSTGRSNTIEILLIDTPSMRWLFRNFPNARYAADNLELPVGETPAVFVSRKVADTPVSAADYRGQDFGWWRFPDWSGAIPPAWQAWLAYHHEPARQEEVILWARSDLFPGIKTDVGSVDETIDQLVAPAGEIQK
jgi:hypothetical protein